MVIDNVILDSLMAWAKIHAPYIQPFTLLPGYSFTSARRRVRLEIDIDDLGRIMCRVYLAEPICYCDFQNALMVCECGPLAETRIA